MEKSSEPIGWRIFRSIGIANFSVRKNHRSSRGKVGKTRANDSGDVRPRDVDINLGAGRAENRAKPIASRKCRLRNPDPTVTDFTTPVYVPREKSSSYLEGACVGHMERKRATMRFIPRTDLSSFVCLLVAS